MKAASIRAQTPPATPPKNGPAIPPTNPLDAIAQLPDPPRGQVIVMLATSNDPKALNAYADQLQATYPAAAAALRLRASTLPQTPTAPTITPPNTPTIDPGIVLPPPPAIVPAQPSPFALDPGMPPEMVKAVLGALTTETDPAKLEGFAQSIQAQYPIAAGLLMAKASALRLQPPKTIVVPPPPPPGPTPSATPLFPIGDDSTRSGRNAGRPTGRVPFVVLGTSGPGNAPVTLAQYGSGSAADYTQLQPLNPQYRIGVDAEFVGQALNVPLAWASKLQAAGYVVQQDADFHPPMPPAPPPDDARALVRPQISSPIVRKGGPTNGAAHA
jgi:hypothetical protein